LSIIDVIGYPVAQVLKGIHSGITSLGVPSDSGWAWGTSIVLLVIFVRLLLFPLFVKQIRSQRRMQEIAPKVKELQKLHKGDRETLNREMMKLYKDNNANPISGCLPLILQLPVFFALFSVLREFKPGAKARFGLSEDLIHEGGRAKIITAPLSSALNDSAGFIRELGGSPSGTRIVAVIMLITMGATTFITQKQMMARNTSTDPTQMQVQKILLYVLPLSFSIFGFSFPIGVLLYWLTTNLWSMGQQYFVIKRMPPPNLGDAGKPGTAARSTGKGPQGGKDAGRTGRRKAEPGAKVELTKGGDADDPGGADGGADGPSVVPPRTASGRPTPSGGRPPGPGRKKSSKKKGRPGGRR
jgi:YidC/Oxa1 family membrane protein insertase